jgi:hypothetical protein
MKRIRLDQIVHDAGTQARASISEETVSDYAERMQAGDTFPAVVLFHDGNHYYTGDGFHRILASQRIGCVDIDAEVRKGTQKDALWYALGANKINGHRMTGEDKRHAILLALTTWPEKSQNMIAEQIGCSRKYVQDIHAEVATTSHLPDRVVGRDGKTYPAQRAKPESVPAPKPSNGNGKLDKSKVAVAQRRSRMREMADQGYSSHQIAGALGISFEGCRKIAQSEDIAVPADDVVGKAKHHDATRIMEHIVMDAENLTADVALIDFSVLDATRIPAWLRSLTTSRDKLGAFIRQLMKEQQKHVEAA